MTLKSKFEDKCHQPWYATHRHEEIYLHTKYQKPNWKDKTVTLSFESVTKGQRSSTMVLDTSSWCDLRIRKISKAWFKKKQHLQQVLKCDEKMWHGWYGNPTQFERYKWGSVNEVLKRSTWRKSHIDRINRVANTWCLQRFHIV